MLTRGDREPPPALLITPASDQCLVAWEQAEVLPTPSPAHPSSQTPDAAVGSAVQMVRRGCSGCLIQTRTH